MNKSIILLLVLVAVATATAHSAQSQESLEELFTKWSSWKTKHAKVYPSSEQEAFRFEIWRENKKHIEENPGEGYKRSLNIFSDLTNEEWKSTYLMKEKLAVLNDETVQEEAVKEHYAYPDSKDWAKDGKTAPVVSQGQCGSCWAFATQGVFNSHSAIYAGKIGDFSQQQLVSCSASYGNGGCGGGVVYYGLQYIKDKSVCSNSLYPYTSGKSRDSGKCDSTKESKCKGSSPAIKSVVFIPRNNCDALAEAVATKGPVGVSVDADRWSDYDGGVFGSCGTSINHAVTLTGYEKGKHWQITNSWGATWGE